MTKAQKIEYLKEQILEQEQQVVLLEFSIFGWGRCSVTEIKAKMKARGSGFESLMGSIQEEPSPEEYKKGRISGAKEDLKSCKVSISATKQYIKHLSK